MKKKLIAALVAGAVLSTGIIGLTACGGDALAINKGTEVSKEEWEAAFTASFEAKNVTIDSYMEMVIKAKGSYEGMQEELGIDSVDLTVTTTARGTNYFDLDNGSYYSKSTSKTKATGVPEKLQEEQDEFKEREFSVEAYCVKDGETYYTAQYYGAHEDAEWEVATSSSLDMSSAGIEYAIDEEFATEAGGTTTAKVSTLYDSFTYSKGVYTATLYRGSSEYTVCVAVKGGYVVGYSKEHTNSEEEETFSESQTTKYVYNFSKYGKTTVKASKEAKKAVEDKKANG